MGFNLPALVGPGDAATSTWANQIRDALAAISDAWTPYTPALTTDGTAPTLGTGNVREGRYLLANKTCRALVGIQWGTSGNTFGTGNYFISIPAPPRISAMALSPIGRGFLYDANVTTPFSIIALRESTTTVKLRSVGLSTFVTPTTPFTFAVNDGFYLELAYEVA